MSDNTIILPENVLAALDANVNQLGSVVMKLSTIMLSMQHRLDELEENQKRMTVNHEFVKKLQASIRVYADQFCDKFSLPDPKPVRLAMKKDILKQFQIKDLHDLPDSAKIGVVNYLEHYSNIRLVMKLKNDRPDH